MKRLMIVLCAVAVVGLAAATAQADVAKWYDVTFTGTDVWTYSADNAAQARTGQAAPRRYRDWTMPSPVQATTYGLPGGVYVGPPDTIANGGFGAWAPGSGFAFDSINLWGADNAAAIAWGEKYVSVGNSDPLPGASSWKVIQSPTGWTSGIVEGGDPWSADATHAFPVWRSSGISDMLGIANMSDPSFKFEFQVLISNPETAFESDGKLRVFFGGFRDDVQGTGADNYEVSGVMTLTATLVPEPGRIVGLLGLAGMGLIGLVWRRRRTA